jgi:hypothetical protein
VREQAERGLPLLICPRAEFGALTADPASAAWSAVPAVHLTEAVSGAEPQQKTSVRAAWSEEELRVLFQVEDTHVWATLTERNGPLWEEEVVEVFLDLFGDLESYFEFEVNPLNTVLDLVLRKNRSGYMKDFSWECEGWRTAVVRTDAGWNAELAIPFHALTSEFPEVGDRWRVNFCRIDRPVAMPRELTAWSPPLRATFHTPERFGVLEFAA